MKSERHEQKIIMPLEEAVELGDIVIKSRAMPGMTGNQSPGYKYVFLDAPGIISHFQNKQFLSTHDSEGYNREYVGYIAYLARIQGKELEVVRAGCLKDHPRFTEVIREEFSPKSIKNLEQSAKDWFENYPWLEKENERIVLKL